jgi:bifunctional DNA-binding transcriptional regulator/antitoxin component of YhaV-PrlF toxin-antitoxin module
MNVPVWKPVRKIITAGEAFAVTLPDLLLRRFGLKKGDRVLVLADKESIIIRPFHEQNGGEQNGRPHSAL